MLANKLRGEVVIDLLGKEWLLRPTFEACAMFEDKVGRSIYKVLQSAGAEGDMPIMVQATAILAGIQGAGNAKPPSFQEVGQAVFKAGALKYFKTVFEFLTYAIAGEEALEKLGKDEAGEKPAPVQEPAPMEGPPLTR